MENKIIQIAENANKGFHYTVSDEQLEAYGKLSIEEKFEWLEETNKFIYALQTPEERELRKNIGNMEL